MASVVGVSRFVLLSFLACSLLFSLVFFGWNPTGGSPPLPLRPPRRRVVPPNMHLVKPLTEPSTPSDFAHHNHLHPPTPRRLGVANTLDSPTIIPLDLDFQTTASRRHAYRYLFTQFRRDVSDLIVYPYPFSVVNIEIDPVTHEEEEVAYWFNRGAFLNTVPYKRRGSFKSIETFSDVQFGQSKALYDFHVGVLKIQTMYMDQVTDLLYEADRYCEMLVTFLGHYGKECLQSSAFESLSDKLAPKLVYIDVEHLRMILSDENKFGILVIPDTILGAEDFIADEIGSSGAALIREFVSGGGLLYVSGKAGLLLEKLDLMPANSFNRDRILVSETNTAEVQGCLDNADPLSQAYVDFVKQMLCFSVTQETSSTYFLSTYLMNEGVVRGSDYTDLFHLSRTGLEKKDTFTGFNMELSPAEKGFLPMVLHRLYGKGQIVVLQGAPVHHTDTVHWFFNALFLAMGRSLYSDTTVKLENLLPPLEDGSEPPIPGNEEGVILEIQIVYHNLFRFPLTDFEVKFWVPKLVAVHEVEILGTTGSCVLQENPFMGPPPSTQPLNDTGFLCHLGLVDGMTKMSVGVHMEILDASVTRRRYGIQILYSQVSYVNSRINERFFYDSGGFYINAMAASVLRCSVNPDPSSFYPFLGTGAYVDNVVTTMNVEHTAAKDVRYVALIPLVTPLLNDDDQRELISQVQFFENYYRGTTNGIGDYPYPFSVPTDYDNIDYHFLSGKDALLSADWDTAVRQRKVVLDTSQVNFPVNTRLANYTSTNTNAYVVTRQQHYDGDRGYFQYATQRQLVFVDSTKEGGAAALYGSAQAIPEARRKPGLNVSRTEYVWIRSDVYFYHSDDQYAEAEGLAINDVVSIDRLKMDFPGEADCDGMSAAIIVQGWFDHTKSPGLSPNQYSNELLNNCQGPMYTSPEGNSTYRKNVSIDEMENVTKTHYLLPVSDEEIRRPADIMNFVEEPVGNVDFGYLESYPEVQFVRAYEITFALSPKITYVGGFLQTILPVGFGFETDPIKSDVVTYTADHIAIYETDWNEETRTITTKFRRGNMPNERNGQDSGIRINLERLTTPEPLSNFSVVLRVFELKYDISQPDLDFERYTWREDMDLLAVKKPFYSLPALKLVMDLKRGENDDGTLLPYERLEPMTRYGAYLQELEKHRTIWSVSESHHVTDPGVTAYGNGFSVVSHVGISSIPFLEYLETGIGQLIPSATETSRVAWRDIWGRQFQQPVRSVFVDADTDVVPVHPGGTPGMTPIPPPLRNFMMTTTFEMTDPKTGERLLEWHSDEVVDVHLKIKLLNSYPKHFDPTTCKENEVYAYVKDWKPPLRISGTPPFPFQLSPEEMIAAGDDSHVDLGHTAQYGSCFAAPGSVVAGTPLGAGDLFKTIARHCSKDDDPEQCEAEQLSIARMERWDGQTAVGGKQWIYAPLVEMYYPDDYISGFMWDLTHYDYDDNVFNSGMMYHMDNVIPNVDTDVLQPQNIIAQPIYKGFGYQMNYNKSHSVFRYPDLQGWWSDNLQSRDNTLLAGQDWTNEISVDAERSLPAKEWIPIVELRNKSEVDVDRALSNIYSCLFNRHRVRLQPGQDRKAYVSNVFQNYVIPIKYVPRASDLTRWDCDLTQAQYEPHNISKWDKNIVTSSSRNWLYFAAALRGGAKETINVVYQLQPYGTSQFEGDTKVSEGGRFVYLNPANGPNSFLIVDNAPNVVKGIRSDLVMDVELFPKSSTPFDVEIYHLIHIVDIAELNRQFTDSYYINHYGFGDSAIWTYVGGVEGSRAVVNPGGVTYVKITFVNNAGFDWNLKAGAIEATEIDKVPISGWHYLHEIRHSIRVPRKYNFMTVEIPEELEPYVSVLPSPHCIRIAPLFFDFQSINTASIRDGFQADYFYNVSISPNLPERLRGRLWQFNVTINADYFDHLPGELSDPTKPGFHDYRLKVPPFKIAIPYSAASPELPNPTFGSKVYHFLGESTDIVHDHQIDKTYDVADAKYLTASQVPTLRDKAANSETSYMALRTWFDSLVDCNMSAFQYDKSAGLVTFSVHQDYPKLPVRNYDLIGPHEAELYILMKSTAKQVPFGTNTLIEDAELRYTDNSKNDRKAYMSEPNFRTINVRGPWLYIEYFVSLGDFEVNEVTGEENWVRTDSQILYPKQDGKMKILIKSTNIGDGIAFNVRYTLHFDRNIEIVESMIDDRYEVEVDVVTGKADLTIFTDYDVSPGVPDSRVYFVTFSPFEELLNRSDYYNFPTERTIISMMTARMDLSEASGQKEGVQTVPMSVTFPFLLRPQDEVTLSGDMNKNDMSVILTAVPNQLTINEKPIDYIFQFKNVTTGDWQLIEVTKASSVVFHFDDILYEGTSYSVTTMDPETMAHLARDEWKYVDVGFLLYILISALPIVAIVFVFVIIGIVGIVIVVKRRNRAKQQLEGLKYNPLTEEMLDEDVTPASAEDDDLVLDFVDSTSTMLVQGGRRVSVSDWMGTELEVRKKKYGEGQ